LGRYTMVGDHAIEGKIDEILHIVTEEIIAHFHPRSIILIGSFGRGEGTVRVTNGKLEVLSDWDFIIISNKYISSGALENLSSALSEKLGLEIGMSGMELSMYFVLSKVFPGVWTATIDNYDMKYGSKLLHGVNYLDKMPNFKPEDISIWEGIRLIFNRMIESLNYISTEYLNTYPSKEQEQRLFSWINKIILACQDALLISAKRYHFSYKIRNKTFQEIFLKYFKALDEQIPNFLPLTIKATEYKLNPKEIYSKDIVEFWFEVAEITDKVFRCIIEKDMGITFDSYAEFQEKYLKHPHIRKKYYRGLSPNPMYQNLRSMIKMWIFGHKIPPINLIKKSRIPWTHIVYSMIPIVYFGLTKNDEANYNLLEKVETNLTLFKVSSDHDQNNSWEEWEYLKKQILNVWYIVCY
jgi:predicted nucleotidyltransferase